MRIGDHDSKPMSGSSPDRSAKTGHGKVARPLFHPFELALRVPPGEDPATLGLALARALADMLPAPLRVGLATRVADLASQKAPVEPGARVLWDWEEIPTGRTLRAVSLDSPTLRAELAAECDLVLLADRQEEGTPAPRLPDGEAEGSGGVALLVASPASSGNPAEMSIPSASSHVHKEDLEAAVHWARGHFQARMAARPLRGLILAGGHSRRMGQDKALLVLGGINQVERTARLLRPLCRDVHLSVREDHAGERARLGLPLLVDHHVDLGPAGGILTALEHDPEAAWLVLGCDLPGVGPDTLADLLAGRDPWKVATAYVSPTDGKLEPLCAIWEPRSRQRLAAHMALGLPCPRRALEHSAVQRLTLARPEALFNMNHPADLQEARRTL